MNNLLKRLVDDFPVATGLCLIYVFLSWSYGLSLRPGQPLTPFMKKGLLYSSIFVFGMAYLMMFGGNLYWSKQLLFTTIAIWAVLVAIVAFWRERRARLRQQNRESDEG